jgi:hypothetical protein
MELWPASKKPEETRRRKDGRELRLSKDESRLASSSEIWKLRKGNRRQTRERKWSAQTSPRSERSYKKGKRLLVVGREVVSFSAFSCVRY